MNRFTQRTLAMLAIGAVGLAACGGDDDSADEPATDSATTEADAPAPTTAPAPTAAPAAAATEPTDPPATAAPDATDAAEAATLLSLADTDLGPILVDADGFTLYMFVPDTDGEPTCTGECAGNWPPYAIADGAELTAAEGLDASLLAAVAHPEGGDMLKYGDWPLYYFAGDGAQGETNGQGVNDVWWVVDATGTPVMN